MKLTDQMIKEAGKEAMDMRLSAIENEEIQEHEFSEEFEANMEELIRSQKDKKRKAYTVWAWRRARVAAVLAFMVVSVSASTVSLEASRSKLIDVVSTTSSGDTTLKFSSSEDSADGLGEITFEYLPEGMVEVDREEDGFLMRYIEFEDKNGQRIIFNQLAVLSSSSYVTDLNTHDMMKSVVYINGVEATLYASEDFNVLLWQERAYLYDLSGYVSTEELILVAEGIKIN